MDFTKTTRYLYMGFETQEDPDTGNTKTNYIKIQNPRTDITANDVKTAGQYLVEKQFWLDANGDSYTTIATAYTEEKAITTLDLS